MKTQLKSASRTLLAVALAVATISFASAQSRWDGKVRAFNTTMEGRGSAHFDGATYSFHQLQLTMQSNKRITVHALLQARDGRDIVFTGKVSDLGRRNGRLSADIDNAAFGRDTNSSDALCDIDMASNDTFRTVTITGRNISDANSLSLDFISNGRTITDFQPNMHDQINRDQRGNRDRNQNQNDRNPDQNRDRNRDRDDFGGRAAAGHYTEQEDWHRRGDHFLMRYALDLARESGQVRMVVSSLEDRNMPNDKDARHDHGDILKYLHDGDQVTQTGTWTQKGDQVVITFDQIRYGDTSRAKREVWKGHIRGSTLIIDDFEKSFYGHSVELSFDRSLTINRGMKQ